MEKMRRARINDSLNELKTLVLEAMKKDVSIRKFTLKNKSLFGFSILIFCLFQQVSRYSKMEKADILEMTVKYLRSLNTERTLHIKQHQGKAVKRIVHYIQLAILTLNMFSQLLFEFFASWSTLIYFSPSHRTKNFLISLRSSKTLF